MHINSEKNGESGYNLNLDLLIILLYSFISWPVRSGLVGKSNLLRPIHLSEQCQFDFQLLQYFWRVIYTPNPRLRCPFNHFEIYLSIYLKQLTSNCIYCHVAFYVIVVNFLMAILIYKFTSIVMNDWNLDNIHAKYWNKVGMFSILTFYDEILSWVIEI